MAPKGKEKEKEPGQGQATISTFFRPSQAAPTLKRQDAIDLTLSSDDDLPAPPQHVHKKTKLVASSSSVPPAPPLASTSRLTSTGAPSHKPAKASTLKVTAAERVSQWRFDPSAPAPASAPLSHEASARKNAFAAKLLAQAGMRRSAYLQGDHYLSANASGSGTPLGCSGDEENEGMDWEEEEEEQESGKGNERKVTTFMSRFAAKGSNASTTGGKNGSTDRAIKYTPLEQQVLALKKANPGVILMIETGYKYRFFEEDAQFASRALGIACFPSKHMLTASIPTHRLNIHIKRLINAGHKVGVVTQQETAALKKVSDNRSGPFARSVSAIYTAATFIDELSVDPLETAGSATSTLLCLVEEANSKDDTVRFGMVAVMPSTGEVVFDDFQDGHMRSELETRMLHLQPQELILQKSMTKQTESIISYLTGQSTSGIDGLACRIERVKRTPTSDAAYSFVTDFYAKGLRRNGKKKAGVVIDDTEEEDPKVNPVLDLLSKSSLVALASLIQHLKSFSLDTVFLHTDSFKHFSSRSVMTLNGNTLSNLEILCNQTDFKERGSLLSVIDHCKTAIGRRLLRKWVAKPLVSLPAVQERLDAITEIVQSSGAPPIVKLRELFRGLPDLERGLVRIHFGKASPLELLRVLQALSRIANVFEATASDPMVSEGEMEASPEFGAVKSTILKRIVASLPVIKDQVDGLLAEIDVQMARDGNKADLFKDPQLFEKVQEAKDCLGAIDFELQDELAKCRKILKLPKLNFVQVSQEEYLIEVPISTAKKLAPDNWTRINSTKAVYRYRTPGVIKKLAELEQCRETLAAEADKAFKEYLQRVSTFYESFRAVVSSVATADCLFSLAVVASLPGYTRPTFTPESGSLKIVGGRHPMVESFRDSFVPNDVQFGKGYPRQMILTGLNMGGKSTASRQFALIALIAQIGSYVPADFVETSIFDGIYTRMGASEDLARARSTFMVELSETSEILKLATPRSLVILDELGRGTSTNDGQAIASAVLEHIVTEVDCICLFVTHYPSLAQVAKKYPDSVSLAHMSCLESNDDVVFLYKLVPGLASRSHGLNVARLAELPASVLVKAKGKAEELERVMDARLAGRNAARAAKIVKALAGVKVGNPLDEGEIVSLAHEYLLGKEA